MAVAVRTIASHLRVTCCMGMLATAEMPRASHIWVMGLLLRLQRSLTSEDRSKKRPPEIQCVSPSDTTRHAEEESSEVDDENLDDYKVDVFIPTIQVQEIRPPEEALQNDFQVCQGQVAEHAGDAFANTC